MKYFLNAPYWVKFLAINIYGFFFIRKDLVQFINHLRIKLIITYKKLKVKY